MISIAKAKRCCPEHYKEIENYEEAVNDPKNKWVCHHRNGEEFSVEWLKKNNMYYYRKDPHEFKFIKDKEHRQLHRDIEFKNNPEEIKQRATNNLPKNISGKNNPFYGKHHTEESKLKISETKKKEPLKSKFGLDYYKHTGLRKNDDLKKYRYEYNFYYRNGKYSWA